MNTVSLTGRLTRDPESRYSQGETPVQIVRFTLAVDRRYKREEADFISCVCFNKTAEFAQKYFKKGMKVGVNGKLQTSSWEGEDKKKHYKTEVLADEVEFEESKASFESRGNQTGDKPVKEEKAESDFPFPEEPIEDDDLPF